MTDIPPARPSSTVVLVRDGDHAPEVFMAQRHEQSSFGEAFAFPGGVLEDDDRRIHEYCAGIDAETANGVLESDNALDYYSAAVRELFEEAGVLLVDDPASRASLGAARRRLNDGELGWRRFVVDEGLRLRCDRLLYFSFWVTPDTMKKRYSTRFFLAEIPTGQTASHCGGELTDSLWITPRDALAASRAGSMVLHFPTMSTLKSIARFRDVAAIKQWCASRRRAGIPCIHPTIVDGKPVIR